MHRRVLSSSTLGELLVLAILGSTAHGADRFASATPHGSAGCPAGTFLDVGRNECWSCPAGHARTVFPVDGAKACERPATTGFAAAARHARGAGLLKTDCPRGQFWDPNGYCYSCPGGYTRTVEAVTGSRACSRPVPAAFAKASGGRRAGCPAGTFPDLGRGDCWSCPAGWYRTVNPVTGGKACANDLADIFAADSSALCARILTGLGEGEESAAWLRASVETLIAPAMRPVDDGLRRLSEQLETPAALDRLIDELARGLRSRPDVVAEAQRLSSQVKKSSRQVMSLLLDPRVACTATPAERDRRLSSLGLRPNLPVRRSGFLEGLFVGDVYAATKHVYVVFSVTVSSAIPGSPPVPFNLGVSWVTDFQSHGAVFFTPGPFVTLPPRRPIIGASLAAYVFPSADIGDFDGIGALSSEVGLGAGKPLKAFLKKAGIKALPDSINLSFDPRALAAGDRGAEPFLLSTGYALSYGVDRNFKEIPRVVEVIGSVDVAFKLVGS